MNESGDKSNMTRREFEVRIYYAQNTTQPLSYSINI